MLLTRSAPQGRGTEPVSCPSTAFAYVHCDVPADMRLDQWRQARNRARRAAESEARRERRAAVIATLRRCVGAR